ncbi:MAG: hypothetical protein KGY70_08350 [Bacteroidales bacterium]|nr:hypothetical protein [Bacteroidales bacterium]
MTICGIGNWEDGKRRRREDGRRRRREDGKTGKGEDEKTRTVNMKRREEED